MGSKYEFDDTREAIGSSNLTNDERKSMLEKFKNAGGQVLSEKELRNRSGSDSSTTMRGSAGKASGRESTSSPLPSDLRKEKRRQEMDLKEQRQALAKKQKDKMSSGSAKFFLKLKCFMNGITPLLQPELKASFLSLITGPFKNALMELQVLTNEIFSKDLKTSKKLIQNLDNKNPLLIEVLEYIQALFKENEFSKIQEYNNDNQKTNIPLDILDEPFRYLLKKLYYLYAYQETARKTFSFAIDFIKENSTDDSINKQRLDQLKKKFSKDMKIIFQTVFPKLFLLISRLDNMEYPPFSPYLEKAINIIDEERLGKREKGSTIHLAGSDDIEEDTQDAESSEESQDEKEGDKKEEKFTSKIMQTKEYQYGYQLMQRLPLPELRKKHDSGNRYEELKIYDRVLISYLFFLEFDHEYSFSLTTNKIIYNIDYSSGVKIDYKKLMADIYNESRGIGKAFENYLDTIKELKKVKTNKTSNYINQSKLETNQENKVNTEARNTRGLIRRYMDQVYQNMAKVIADIQNENKIIGNLDDKVKFNKELEGEKRLNGAKVSDVISETYSYATALRERLTNGDLYGGIVDFTKEEMTEIFGKPYGYEQE